MRRPAALALAALTLLLAVAAIADLVAWHDQRAELLRTLDEVGIAEEEPEIVRRLERERSPEAARLATARILVYRVLAMDVEALRAADPATLSAELERAEDLARRTLAVQPGNWQAEMLVGGALYLRWTLERDRRLVSEAPRWEEPLAAAVADAGGQSEPKRLLVAAYLDVWPHLSADKRRRTRDLLEELFAEDLAAFRLLAPSWLAVAGDPDVAFSVIPEEPTAWDDLRRYYADTRSWTSYLLAHRRWLDALEAELEERYDEAERRLALGDFFRSRQLFLNNVAGAPPSRRFADVVGRSLEIYPPGLHGLGNTPIRGWLDWSLELEQVGVEGLGPAALARLLDALGDAVPADVAAHAALVAGDIYLAERFGKLVDPFRAAATAPYLVARAARLLEEGDATAARESLEQVPGEARRGIAWATVRRQVSRAVGDAVAEAAAEELLAELRADRFSAADWRWRRGRPTLELLPARAAEGLEIEIAEAPASGSVVEVTLDGRTVSTRVVRPGDVLRLVPLPVDASPHLLTLRLLAGGQVVPGEVRLVS